MEIISLIYKESCYVQKIILTGFLPISLLSLSLLGEESNDLSTHQLSVPLLLEVNADRPHSELYPTLIGSGFCTFGKEKQITFKDIIGGVPEDIVTLKEFIQDCEHYKNAGAVMPKGYIFYGPPGTGKTLLARALAGEVGCPFAAVSGADFTSKYVGDGVRKVKEIFAWAREQIEYYRKKQVIIFIDELDSIGNRSSDDSAAAQDGNKTINQLLVEMDGFDQQLNIIVIGATNRLELLDEALKRPGRFEYHIQIGLPSKEKREALLKDYASEKFNRRVDSSVDFDIIAKKTTGFSCADISSLVNRAAIFVAHKRETVITQEAFDAALGSMKK